MAPTNTSENFGGLQHVDQELNTSIDGEFVKIVEKWQTQALKLSCNVYFLTFSGNYRTFLPKLFIFFARLLLNCGEQIGRKQQWS